MTERQQSPRAKLIKEFARGIARASIRELKKAEFIATTRDEEREMHDIVEYVARRELATLPELAPAHVVVELAEKPATPVGAAS